MAETWVFSGPNNTPTEAEKRLIAGAETGEEADCSGLSKTERVVSASLLVAVASGVFKPPSGEPWSLNPDGVVLVGADVPEKVRASNRSFPAPVRLFGCRFLQGVVLAHAVVDGSLWFDGCTLRGGCDLSGAEIGGQFSAENARFLNRGKQALFAQDARASGWFIGQARFYGQFNVAGANIVGQFNANGARFLNRGGQALRAQGVRAEGWFMDRARVYGEFDINGAVLTGQFSGNGAWFANRRGKAVNAQKVLAVDWFLKQARVYGSFDINSADVAGQLVANEAQFLNQVGNSVMAEFACIGGGVFLRNGTRFLGLLDLAHAQIGQALDLEEACLAGGASAVALDLSSAKVMGKLIMPEAFPRGIIDLSRAHAAVLIDTVPCWPEPLDRNCGHVGRLMSEEEGHSRDIQHMVLDGFTYDHIEYPAGDPEKPASAVGKARIDWLCGQSARDLKEHFNPQPWRQMAKVLREMGYAKAAEEVLIEMRVRERHADGVSRRDKVVNWLLENLADYGFNPWRTVRISLYLIALFALAYLGGARACGGLSGWDSAARLACGGQPAFLQAKFNDFEEVVQKDDAGEPKRDRYNALQLDKARPGYPDFSAFFYSLDAFTPVLDLGAEGFWHPNTKAWWTPKWLKGWKEGLAIPIGWLLYILTVVEAFLGSILTAIAISAFTGFLRPEEK